MVIECFGFSIGYTTDGYQRIAINHALDGKQSSVMISDPTSVSRLIVSLLLNEKWEHTGVFFVIVLCNPNVLYLSSNHEYGGHFCSSLDGRETRVGFE